MPGSRDEPDFDSWIFALGEDQAKVQLGKRGLPDEGTLTAMRTRLLRYERNLRQKTSPAGAAKEVAGDSSDEASPAETILSGVGGRRGAIPRASPTTPRAERTRGPRPPTALDVCALMQRWNIHYSGARGGGAETFLARIRAGREVARIPDGELISALPFFLSGLALEWFELKRRRFRTWESFESAWRARFCDADFQDALEEEIRERIQGDSEPVADFLTCLGGLFRRLDPPWSVSRQVTMALRNLAPTYALAIRREEVHDLDGLEILAVRIERTLLRSRSARVPRTPERSVCPELAYHGPRRRVRRGTGDVAATGVVSPGSRGASPGDREREGAEAASAKAATATRATKGTVPETAKGKEARKRTVRCWNCDREGHFARDCPRDKRVHCFRCGAKDETLRTCPKCPGTSGNESGSP